MRRNQLNITVSSSTGEVWITKRWASSSEQEIKQDINDLGARECADLLQGIGGLIGKIGLRLAMIKFLEENK